MTGIDLDVLAAVDPHRSQRGLLNAWQRTHRDYVAFVDAHGRAPLPADAAGLSGWMAEQHPAHLTRSELRLVETLPGFTHGLDRPAAMLIAALRDAGASWVRPQAEIGTLPAAAHIPDSVRALAGSGLFVAAATHTARYGHQPEWQDHGSRWHRHTPPELCAAAQRLLDDATDPAVVRLSVARAAHIYQRWTATNSRAPKAASTDARERKLAHWRSTIRASIKAGRLTEVEQRAVIAALG